METCLSFFLQHIQLTFNHFELEHHAQCDWDVFQVFVGSSNQPAHELCGSHSGTLTLASNHVILILISDVSVTAAGYDITYTAFAPETDSTYHFMLYIIPNTI